jgi:hypothetical protein
MINIRIKTFELRFIVALTFLLMSINYGCRKDAINTESAFLSTSDPKVLAAKLWYESKFKVSSETIQKTRTQSESALELNQFFKPDWKECKNYIRYEDEVIEVPIDSSNKIGLKISTNQQTQEYSRSSVLILKKGDLYRAFIMTIVGDKEYINGDLSKLTKNSYGKRDDNFSGLVYYTTPEGKFVNGWIYKNGAVKGRLSATASNVSNQTVQSLKPNLTLVYEVCTAWYQRVPDDEGDGYHWEFLDITDCHNVYETYPDLPSGGGGNVSPGGSGGSTGGGGSGTPSQNPTPCIPQAVSSLTEKAISVNGLKTFVYDYEGHGFPPPEEPEPCPPDNAEEYFSGRGQVNVQPDPDFPSDCASWAYVPVVNGDYQVCGVNDLRFDYITEFQNSQNKLEVDYFRGTFDQTIYFEFPKTRIDGSIITSAEAARLTALAKDNAEDILESQVEASPPPSNNTEAMVMLNRFMNILKSQVQNFGGRVTTKNNYNTRSVRNYSKGIGGC